MRMDIVITGDTEVARFLSKCGDRVQGSHLENACKAGALLLQNRMKELAPVLTGTLRRSIHTESTGGGSSVEISVGTNVPYAKRLEFGFSGTDSLGRTYNQPARPYMRPAMEQTRTQVVSEIAASLRRLLEAA